MNKLKLKRTQKKENPLYDHNDPFIRKQNSDRTWLSCRRASAIKNLLEGKDNKTMSVLLNTPEQDYEEPPKESLFIYGDSGFGKTVDACRRVLPFIKQWHFDCSDTTLKNIPKMEIIFYVTFDLINKIYEVYGNKNSDKEALLTLDRCKNCDVLILDDIGSERKTPNSDQILFEIIYSRSKLGKITVITSNKDMAEDSGFDLRIIRRVINEYIFFNFKTSWDKKIKNK